MKIKGYFYGIGAALIWSTVFFFGRIVMTTGDIHPVAISFWRCFFASVFLFALLGGKYSKIIAALRNNWKDFIFLSFTGIFLFNILVFSSLLHTTATSSSILMNANPIFILIIASFLLGEKITYSKIVAVITGFAGCVLVIMETSGNGFAGNGAFKGNIMATAGALCWALYTVKGRELTRRYGSIMTTFINLAGGMVFLLAATLISGIKLTTSDPLLIVSGAYFGIIPAGVGFTMWYNSLKYIEAGKLGILQYITPAATAVLASVFLEETMTFMIVSGMAVIFFSIYVSTFSKNIKTPPL